MEEMYQDVTITPIRRLAAEPFMYRLLVYGKKPNLWTTPGIYSTPEKVLASFAPPLCVEYQTQILDTLRDGKEVKIRLNDSIQ
ncbi:hypothetical protein [Occallatibacter savannae]|uniref:hypothetical protein n=1 Tax=Occallatibacter savannae TaxID=1002691 RepID=UPI000D698670|nr:hypothetical protein [Occallatibacter savannae]